LTETPAAAAQDDGTQHPPDPVVYDEPARGYGSLGMFGAIIVVGVVLDGFFGGLRSHIVGWIIAAVLLFGVDLLIIRAARTHKSLRVTTGEIRVGEQFVERRHVATLAAEVAPDAPVLGWLTGLPRGMSAVGLRLVDGTAVTIPTKRPDRLRAALDLTAAPDDEIREATAEDLPLLAEIGERADAVFRVAGYELPDLVPAPVPGTPTVFVAGRPPYGFVRIVEVDGAAHVDELAVLPARMRAGLGTRLLERAVTWARDQGLPAVTLTTFRDVPWNAPFYARRGFTVVDDPTPGLAAIRARERQDGLDDVGPRVVMRRQL